MLARQATDSDTRADAASNSVKALEQALAMDPLLDREFGPVLSDARKASAAAGRERSRWAGAKQGMSV